MRVLVSCASLLLAVSCGGSSSETPPPLEPDPEALVAGRPPASSADGSEAIAPNPNTTVSPGGELEVSPFEIEPRYPGSTDGEPKRPPVQTWGSSPRASVPPPKPELAPAP